MGKCNKRYNGNVTVVGEPLVFVKMVQWVYFQRGISGYVLLVKWACLL